jgi:hypothetical protein
MQKLILTGLFGAATLGLAACGDGREENVAIENVEELNTTDDMNMSMDNMDMNMDMNATDNGMSNATDNAAGNDTTGNSY